MQISKLLIFLKTVNLGVINMNPKLKQIQVLIKYWNMIEMTFSEDYVAPACMTPVARGFCPQSRFQDF